MKIIILLFSTMFIFSQTSKIIVNGVKSLSNNEETVFKINHDYPLLDNQADLNEQCQVWFVSELPGDGHFINLEESLSSELVSDNDIIYLKTDQNLHKTIKINKSVTIRSQDFKNKVEIIGTLYFENGADIVLQDLIVTSIDNQVAIINENANVMVFSRLILNGAAYNNKGSIFNQGTIKINN